MFHRLPETNVVGIEKPFSASGDCGPNAFNSLDLVRAKFDALAGEVSIG